MTPRTPASPAHDSDVLLVGGGLANGLIALRLAALHPGLRVTMLEREPVRDDAHTWCMFRSDVPETAWRWLEPLFENHWHGYRVGFPEFSRELGTDYVRLTGPRLAAAVEAVLGPRLLRGVQVAEVTPESAIAADGRRWRAPLVIDGRGLTASDSLRLAWQKFSGVELRLAAPHGLSCPVLMDACVRQSDGFRFIYLLPVSADTLLVEDTRYSNSPLLDVAALEVAIARYVEARRWRIAAWGRRECGVLPIALSGDIERFWRERVPGVPAVGMRAALFHPTTGYSLPDAARTADLIATAPRFDSATIAPGIEAHAKALWRRRAFYRGLNRMLFMAAAPEQRFVVLQRFYRLSQPLIERFYADRLTMADKARILTGRPPIPMGRAFAALQASDTECAHA
ncbi:MAG: lycopene beta-cyclase CrtY [Steroidobacteraceae bacterium]|nr:lycopene beta-cyclase CrtY [Steroidobacteraceae bacterium]